MERAIQKRVDVDGSWVSVDIYGEGDGPTLVAVPGVLADAAGWAPVAERIEGWRTVAVVNRRGRHPSGPLTDRYSLAAEVRDALAVIDSLPQVETVFGWSYGGLIALVLAEAIEVPQVIAYEAIMAPFGALALPDLQHAHAVGDVDESLNVVLQQIARTPGDAVAGLRGQEAVWSEMRRLAEPVYLETLAIQEAQVPAVLAARAGRVDLVIGERNRDRAPYGTTFADVARRAPSARVHTLAGQGHLAHLEAPDQLAALIDQLGRKQRQGVRRAPAAAVRASALASVRRTRWVTPARQAP